MKECLATRRRYLVLICIILVGIGLTFALYYLASGEWGFGQDNQSKQEIDIDYLIECMERARDSHQQFLDMPPKMELGPITINEPARYYLNRISPYTTLEDQREWVNIYDQVIEVLRSMQSGQQTGRKYEFYILFDDVRRKMDKLLSMVSENVTHAYNAVYETVNGTVVRIWLYTEYPAPTAPAPPAVPAPVPEPTPWLAIMLSLVVTSIIAIVIVWWYGFRNNDLGRIR